MRYEFNPTSRPVKKLVEVKTFVVIESELNENEFSEYFNTKKEAINYIKRNGSNTLAYYEKTKRIWR